MYIYIYMHKMCSEQSRTKFIDKTNKMRNGKYGRTVKSC